MEVVQSRRQRARSQDEREILYFLLREGAADAPFRRDARLHRRRGLDTAVEDDRELAADVLARRLPELASAFAVQREADRRPVVLVERRARVAEIAAGHGGDLLHQVIEVAGIARAADAGDDLHPLRNAAVHHQLFFVAGDAFDDLQLEQTRRSDDRFRALDFGHAGELHDDLIAACALLRDLRLGDAQLVDPALDRLPRLDNGLIAQVHLHVRPHRERVRAVDSRPAVEVRRHFRRRLTKRGVLRRRNAFDLELRRADAVDARDGNVARPQLFAQPLHLGFRFQPQRIVGLHAQDEMHAAFEVETELQLLVLHPSGCRQVLPRGEDRVHPDHEEHDEDADDGDDFPAYVLHGYG